MENNLRELLFNQQPQGLLQEKIEANILYIKDVDILDKTPLLDLKPYVPGFDRRDGVKIGWQGGKPTLRELFFSKRQ